MGLQAAKMRCTVRRARLKVALEFNCNERLFSLERRGGGEGCAPLSQVTSPLHGSVTLELFPLLNNCSKPAKQGIIQL